MTSTTHDPYAVAGSLRGPPLPQAAAPHGSPLLLSPHPYAAPSPTLASPQPPPASATAMAHSSSHHANTNITVVPGRLPLTPHYVPPSAAGHAAPAPSGPPAPLYFPPNFDDDFLPVSAPSSSGPPFLGGAVSGGPAASYAPRGTASSNVPSGNSSFALEPWMPPLPTASHSAASGGHLAPPPQQRPSQGTSPMLGASAIATMAAPAPLPLGAHHQGVPPNSNGKPFIHQPPRGAGAADDATAATPDGTAPPPMCPQDAECTLLNDREHQAMLRHTCRLRPCLHLSLAAHARLFLHDASHEPSSHHVPLPASHIPLGGSSSSGGPGSPTLAGGTLLPNGAAGLSAAGSAPMPSILVGVALPHSSPLALRARGGSHGGALGGSHRRGSETSSNASGGGIRPSPLLAVGGGIHHSSPPHGPATPYAHVSPAPEPPAAAGAIDTPTIGAAARRRDSQTASLAAGTDHPTAHTLHQHTVGAATPPAGGSQRSVSFKSATALGGTASQPITVEIIEFPPTTPKTVFSGMMEKQTKFTKKWTARHVKLAGFEFSYSDAADAAPKVVLRVTGVAHGAGDSNGSATNDALSIAITGHEVSSSAVKGSAASSLSGPQTTLVMRALSESDMQLWYLRLCVVASDAMSAVRTAHSSGLLSIGRAGITVGTAAMEPTDLPPPPQQQRQPQPTSGGGGFADPCWMRGLPTLHPRTMLPLISVPAAHLKYFSALDRCSLFYFGLVDWLKPWAAPAAGASGGASGVGGATAASGASAASIAQLMDHAGSLTPSAFTKVVCVVGETSALFFDLEGNLVRCLSVAHFGKLYSASVERRSASVPTAGGGGSAVAPPPPTTVLQSAVSTRSLDLLGSVAASPAAVVAPAQRKNDAATPPSKSHDRSSSRGTGDAPSAAANPRQAGSRSPGKGSASTPCTDGPVAASPATVTTALRGETTLVVLGMRCTEHEHDFFIAAPQDDAMHLAAVMCAVYYARHRTSMAAEDLTAFGGPPAVAQQLSLDAKPGYKTSLLLPTLKRVLVTSIAEAAKAGAIVVKPRLVLLDDIDSVKEQIAAPPSNGSPAGTAPSTAASSPGSHPAGARRGFNLGQPLSPSADRRTADGAASDASFTLPSAANNSSMGRPPSAGGGGFSGRRSDSASVASASSPTHAHSHHPATSAVASSGGGTGSASSSTAANSTAHLEVSTSTYYLSPNAPNATPITLGFQGRGVIIQGDWSHVKLHSLRRYLFQVFGHRPAVQVLHLRDRTGEKGRTKLTDDLSFLSELGVREGSVLDLTIEEQQHAAVLSYTPHHPDKPTQR